MRINNSGQIDAQIRHIFGTYSARIRHTFGRMTRKLAAQKDLEIQKGI
jgi:hypothetical protein